MSMCVVRGFSTTLGACVSSVLYYEQLLVVCTLGSARGMSWQHLRSAMCGWRGVRLLSSGPGPWTFMRQLWPAHPHPGCGTSTTTLFEHVFSLAICLDMQLNCVLLDFHVFPGVVPISLSPGAQPQAAWSRCVLTFFLFHRGQAAREEQDTNPTRPCARASVQSRTGTALGEVDGTGRLTRAEAIPGNGTYLSWGRSPQRGLRNGTTICRQSWGAGKHCAAPLQHKHAPALLQHEVRLRGVT